MPLATQLAGVRALHDLPGLFAALGYEPLWHELPDGALVARCGDFLWVGCTRAGGQERAARRAVRLSRGGRIAGVAALDHQGRTLELAIGFHGDPARRVSLDTPSLVDLARLERLRPDPDAPALATAARVAEALASEETGTRFFRAFRTTLSTMREALPNRIPPDDRHALALLQLTRVLVLYFVQSKGWLDGHDRFLREAVDDCLAGGRAIHRDLLRPLFFGALNQPATRRSRSVARLGRIPFLNGGLFEPHALERRWKPEIPSATWLSAFDDLFERYHFVVRTEDGPGIAPDMLGQVFEGVMEPDLRLASGSFYTPAALVDTLLREGMTALLATRLRVGGSTAERLLDDPSPAARSILESMTVLDPAVGSGAFLLGALRLLAAPWAADVAVLSARKRAIVSRSLFGVDVNANAVRLAELRLWLEVIAADPAEHPEQVEPLPNLDALLRQGDSLADPAMGGVPFLTGTGGRLGALRHQLATSTGLAKRAATRTLRLAERDLFRAALASALDRVERRIGELITAARDPSLFESRRGLDRTGQRRLAEFRRERAWLRRQLRGTTRDEQLPWFHYQSHFGDVFSSSGGFDLVVGNPPWVRGERLRPEQRAALAQRYRWWRGDRAAAGYAHSPDVAVAFLERATELVAPGGVIAMLVPAKVTTAGYATVARAALASTTTLHLVADLSRDHAGAFDATVYPLALVCGAASSPVAHRVRGGFHDAPSVPQARLGAGPWVIVPDPLREALDQLRGDHPRIEDSHACHLGVKTGCNRAFLDPTDDVEPMLLRWAVRGRDLKAFAVHPRRRLLWTHAASGDPLPALPPRAAAWIERHRTALLARRDYVSGPAWTVFRAGPAVAEHRVVWPDLARQLLATPLTGAAARDLVPLNTCYLMTVSNGGAARRLAAWLNSTWLRAAARHTADAAASGFARFNARVVGALPLPPAALRDPDLAGVADAALANPTSPHPWQEDLDDLVARHLALGPAHRRALAGDLGQRTGARR